MSDLIALVERRLGVSWADIVEWLRQQNGLSELEARLQTGDMASVIRDVDTAAERFAADIHAGYVLAGQRTAASLDEQLPKAIIRFDVTNDRAVAFAEQNKLDLVRGLTQEQAETARQVIVAGVRSGQNPLATARDLRDTIGLAPAQADAVASYRRALEAGDYRNAIDRALSDGRSDRSLEAAIRNDTTVAPERIDGMVERYRSNMVDYRAQVVARTESLRVVHQGNEDMYHQAIQRGDVEAHQLVREWNSAHDGRVRPSHRAMDGQQRKLGEKFTTGDGVGIDFPGDPSAPVEETVQCRCVLSTRLTG